MNGIEVTIDYWQCPQNGDHIFDADDWRIEQNYWTGRARCPYDFRYLDRKVATVGTKK